MTLKSLFLLPPLLLTACALDEGQPDPDLEEDTQEIHGDQVSSASQFQVDRAVKIPGCTATKISARFAITSAHCMPSVGDSVNYYTSASGKNTSKRSVVVGVTLRPGVNSTACFNDIDDCWDSSGKFADMALLELALPTSGAGTEPDLEGFQATLAWEYPGEDVAGKKVGAGLHDGDPNDDGTLLQHPDSTSRDNDTDGRFYTVDDHADPGDSGGPFYVGSKVLGTLWGKWWEPFDHYNIYTSVPLHLDWILGTIEYRWRGLPPLSNTLYSGTSIDSFRGTERECQYACEKTSSCEAYNLNTNAPAGTPNCFLHDNITQTSSISGWRGAVKNGARASNANDVVGFVRTDNTQAVVHKALNGNLHEIALMGGTTWTVHDINPAATVSSKLSVYRRVEGVDAIVFRSSTNHIIQLLRNGSATWTDEADLTALAGGELAAGNPTAYVRADGVNAVVYRGATTGHIWELRRGSRGFIATDLTAAAGSSVAASSDPMANARSDGYSSVVFRSTGGNLYELYKTFGGGWGIGGPASLAGAPAPADRPFAFTKRDGTNSVIYRQDTGQIVELTLSGGQWNWEHISSNAVGQPVAYVRADAVDTVMFRNTSSQLVQVTAATTNLTSLTGAASALTNPAVYVRSDGYNSVLFESSGNHIGEIYVKLGGAWADGDITGVAGETP